MLHLVLCWHFHQPDYRDADGRYQLPWTYLHAVKDYADMAAHLESAPNVCCVVNFVPTLTAQILDYAEQFASGELRDPLLESLLDPALSARPPAQRRALVEQCFKVNAPTMLEPFAPYRRLQSLWCSVADGGDVALELLSEQFYADLVTWYHLAWTGETVRRARADLMALMHKGEGFTLADRRALFELYGEVVADLLPRYRRLAARGQIELSATPHSHPILPLLLDFNAAREARPGLPLPQAPGYPGGEARARAHIEAALADHVEHFGQAPGGCWPAEGGVSEAALRLFSAAGVRWVATGEGVLRHSLSASGMDMTHKPSWCYTPYRLTDSDTVLFFRDDHLSDLIGFEYKGWHSADAARHFITTLDEARRNVHHEHAVVSVILDGENAWEYYPFNGYYFLSELYAQLSASQTLHTTTFGDYLELYPHTPRALPRLVAGSWVYGDFTTWMGDAAKNRGWDWLVAAKLAYDRAVRRLPRARREQAEALLRSCESSDWFWWFGDYNPGDAVASFDRVYRQKLKRLYQTLGVTAPDYLDQPLCHGGGSIEAGGVMRRGG